MEHKKINISYTYDQLDRLSSVSHGDGKTVRYSYDGAGNLVYVQAFTGTGGEGVKGFPVPEIVPGTAAGETSVSWFINREGQTMGPYTWEEMVFFASDGRIENHDLVWNRDMSGWALAKDITGLIKR